MPSKFLDPMLLALADEEAKSPCQVKQHEHSLRILDLFSGIGGFSLGLERTGYFRTVAFCEADETARRVLRKHWPSVDQFPDVRELCRDGLELAGVEPVDVIVGGFPCQDISLAGKGAGLAGERSGLWFEFHRLIAEIRPQFAIVENVSLLRSRGLDTVLGSLSEIGYDAEWHCIPAATVGAPHLRDRIWVVAYPNNKSEPVVAEHDEASWLQAISSIGEWPRWSGKPEDVRMDDGLPGGMDRVRQLGNSLVPQIPQLLGEAIARSICLDLI